MFLQFWLGVREHLQVLNSPFVLSNNDLFHSTLKKYIFIPNWGKIQKQLIGP